MIQLKHLVLCADAAQQLLGRLAVGAVALAEDGDGVVVDDALGLGLCGGHGAGAWGAVEEAGEEGNFGGVFGLLVGVLVGGWCGWGVLCSYVR